MLSEVCGRRFCTIKKDREQNVPAIIKGACHQIDLDPRGSWWSGFCDGEHLPASSSCRSGRCRRSCRSTWTRTRGRTGRSSPPPASVETSSFSLVRRHTTPNEAGNWNEEAVEQQSSSSRNHKLKQTAAQQDALWFHLSVAAAGQDCKTSPENLTMTCQSWFIGQI